MKYYLEITEQLTDEERLIKQPQSLRKEIFGDTATERMQNAKQLYNILSEVVGFNFEHTAKIHNCGHEDGMACELIELDM